MRKQRILYFGLEVPADTDNICWTHCPLIETKPVSLSEAGLNTAFQRLTGATHLIFTSKMAVRYFVEACDALEMDMRGIQKKRCLSVGAMTTKTLTELDFSSIETASTESAEGIVALLQEAPSNASFFWAHSRRSRTLITDFLSARQILHTTCVLYDTLIRKPEVLPRLVDFDELFFSSPSTVEAFFTIYKCAPPIPYRAQGIETEKACQRRVWY